jgi:hypothetical protein
MSTYDLNWMPGYGPEAMSEPLAVVHECLDNDSPWLICKHCGAVGRVWLRMGDGPETVEYVPAASLPSEPEQPEPEPVAYLYSHDETGRTALRMPEDRLQERRWSEHPLFMRAPQPLTERVAELEAALRMVKTTIDEADQGYTGIEFTYPYKQWAAAVRAVLAAQGKKT